MVTLCSWTLLWEVWKNLRIIRFIPCHGELDATKGAWKPMVFLTNYERVHFLLYRKQQASLKMVSVAIPNKSTSWPTQKHLFNLNWKARSGNFIVAREKRCSLYRFQTYELLSSLWTVWLAVRSSFQLWNCVVNLLPPQMLFFYI